MIEGKHDKRIKRRTGTQLDVIKRVRKEMPPPTKVIKEKNRPKDVNNWREFLQDDEDGNYNG